ncbi:MAG: hypothetical protein KAR20_06980, partial [Candidatus Heimdallarchaeota archaeon]|nr:hypothetical protein [Candidatus Heimdallarchaeota archaeon]
KIRRMSKIGTDTECKYIPSSLLSPEELRKFNHHVRRNRGELLFAKTWLLVEGETEVSVFVECAEILEIHLHRYGIRLVEYGQAGGPSIFIKVADALGIDWHVVADNDDAGKKYSESAEIYLGDSNKDDYISMLKKSNMDVLLCNAGYGEPYKEGLPSQTPPELRGSWDEVLEEMKRTFVNKPGQALKVAKKLRDRALPIVTAEEGTEEYWEQVYRCLKNGFSKPAAALEAIILMKKTGKDGVPEEIRSIFHKIMTHAGGTE